MPKEVIMPALGVAQETGTLLQWLKVDGDTVSKGEPIMEIETDKTVLEIEATASGTLASISAQPGDEVPVGQQIALILAAGEDAPVTSTVAAPAIVDAPDEQKVTRATPVARVIAGQYDVPISEIPHDGDRVRKSDALNFIRGDLSKPNLVAENALLASPKAKRIASEKGIDLSTIGGSGPNGAIITVDLTGVEADSAAENTTIPLSRSWNVMGARLTESWQTTPHFYLNVEADAEEMIAWQQSLKARGTSDITLSDLLVKLVASALAEHPRINSSWENDTIRTNPSVNVGLAVAANDSLTVPVIHDAGQLSLTEIASRRRQLVDRAKGNKLTIEDMSRGTFTISNLGMLGIDSFNAIVNPPQAAILAVGRTRESVVAVNGEVMVRRTMSLTLSCDHRAIDGAMGSRFLQTLVATISDPMRLLD